MSDHKRQVFVTRRQTGDSISLSTPSGDKIDITIHQTRSKDSTLIIQATDDIRISIKKAKQPEPISIHYKLISKDQDG